LKNGRNGDSSNRHQERNDGADRERDVAEKRSDRLMGELKFNTCVL
jgi:hypothetical protein